MQTCKWFLDFCLSFKLEFSPCLVNGPNSVRGQAKANRKTQTLTLNRSGSALPPLPLLVNKRSSLLGIVFPTATPVAKSRGLTQVAEGHPH